MSAKWTSEYNREFNKSCRVFTDDKGHGKLKKKQRHDKMVELVNSILEKKNTTER